MAGILLTLSEMYHCRYMTGTLISPFGVPTNILIPVLEVLPAYLCTKTGTRPNDQSTLILYLRNTPVDKCFQVCRVVGT